jgi:phosphoglycolate phosphatase-like HAD superfamily hydrolase
VTLTVAAPPLQLVIFDLDGTLAYSVPAIGSSFCVERALGV